MTESEDQGEYPSGVWLRDVDIEVTQNRTGTTGGGFYFRHGGACTLSVSLGRLGFLTSTSGKMGVGENG